MFVYGGLRCAITVVSAGAIILDRSHPARYDRNPGPLCQVVGERFGDTKWPERVDAVLVEHRVVVHFAKRIAAENTGIVDEDVNVDIAEFLPQGFDGGTAAHIDTVDNACAGFGEIVVGLATHCNHVVAAIHKLLAKL